MSEFTDILTSSLKIKRLTAHLLDKVGVSASLSVDRQPQRACRLNVAVSGATIQSGLVNIAGSTNESFAFTENDIKIGIKDFTSISGIAVSGISDGFIEIKAVSRTGQPVNQEKEIYDSLAVRFFAISGRIRMQASGQEKIAKYKFMAAPDKVIQENDLIYAIAGIQGMTRGQVNFVEQIMDFDGATHHVEAEVMPL